MLNCLCMREWMSEDILFYGTYTYHALQRIWMPCTAFKLGLMGCNRWDITRGNLCERLLLLNENYLRVERKECILSRSSKVRMLLQGIVLFQLFQVSIIRREQKVALYKHRYQIHNKSCFYSHNGQTISKSHPSTSPHFGDDLSSPSCRS